MKSIIEEASSIAKAVERGWEKAGKPKEFTVKIFEEAQKNFFGFTKQSAKVGIFFQELADKPQDQVKPYQNKPAQRRPLAAHNETAEKAQHPQQARKSAVVEKKEAPVASETAEVLVVEWTPVMVETASNWLKGMLESIDKGSVGIVCEVHGATLQFFIQEQIVADPQQEKHLFINFSTLIIQAIKRKTRKSLKGYRVSVFRQK